MSSRAEFSKWMRVFAVRMRIGIVVFLAGAALYADLTNTWKDFYAILPFGLLLIPGYIEWPFEVRWPQHPAFRTFLSMIPIATPACFIGSFNRFGLKGAILYTGATVVVELLLLAFLAIWLKRNGMKL
jgi:hypothetical protein